MHENMFSHKNRCCNLQRYNNKIRQHVPYDNTNSSIFKKIYIPYHPCVLMYNNPIELSLIAAACSWIYIRRVKMDNLHICILRAVYIIGYICGLIVPIGGIICILYLKKQWD